MVFSVKVQHLHMGKGGGLSCYLRMGGAAGNGSKGEAEPECFCADSLQGSRGVRGGRGKCRTEMKCKASELRRLPISMLFQENS